MPVIIIQVTPLCQCQWPLRLTPLAWASLRWQCQPASAAPPPSGRLLVRVGQPHWLQQVPAMAEQIPRFHGLDAQHCQCLQVPLRSGLQLRLDVTRSAHSDPGLTRCLSKVALRRPRRALVCQWTERASDPGSPHYCVGRARSWQGPAWSRPGYLYFHCFSIALPTLTRPPARPLASQTQDHAAMTGMAYHLVCRSCWDGESTSQQRMHRYLTLPLFREQPTAWPARRQLQQLEHLVQAFEGELSRDYLRGAAPRVPQQLQHRRRSLRLPPHAVPGEFAATLRGGAVPLQMQSPPRPCGT